MNLLALDLVQTHRAPTIDPGRGHPGVCSTGWRAQRSRRPTHLPNYAVHAFGAGLDRHGIGSEFMAVLAYVD